MPYFIDIIISWTFPLIHWYIAMPLSCRHAIYAITLSLFRPLFLHYFSLLPLFSLPLLMRPCHAIVIIDFHCHCRRHAITPPCHADAISAIAALTYAAIIFSFHYADIIIHAAMPLMLPFRFSLLIILLFSFAIDTDYAITLLSHYAFHRCHILIFLILIDSWYCHWYFIDAIDIYFLFAISLGYIFHW